MTIAIFCEPRFLAVFVGFVVLLTILEKSMMTRPIMLTNLGRIICRTQGLTRFRRAGMRYLGLPFTGLVPVLIRLPVNRTLLNAFILFVLSHCESSMLEWEEVATRVPFEKLRR